MTSDKKLLHTLETIIGPDDIAEINNLICEAGFKYRNATGELIFAMMTCQADVSFPIMKLSLYNNRPALCHFKAIKDVYRYLNNTSQDGLIFWQPRPNNTLPSTQHMIPHKEPYTVNIPTESKNECTAYGMADSDFASDHKTRKTVGSALIFFGGAIIV